MFVGLTNAPRDYAWGTSDEIARLLGREPSGGPEAEYWLGTHPGSPARLVDGPMVDGSQRAQTLDQLTELPFIMKVLSARMSLSLQAHPSPELAREGFARENAEGIPFDDPKRNYKDPHAKPEMIYAIVDGFVALCGFRPVAATRELLRKLGPDPLVDDWIARLSDDAAIRPVLEWLLSNTDGVPELRERVIGLAAKVDVPEFANARLLATEFPGDVGILVSLLLNLVTLRAGEAVFLPAGNIHAYQRGLGIEVLAASDNVLRGGLTPKHVDIPELLKVLDFRPLPVPFLQPIAVGPGVRLFQPDAPEFELAVLTPHPGEPARFAPSAEYIALCTDGPVNLTSGSRTVTLHRGDAEYGTADETPIEFEGEGTVYLATRGRRSA